MQDDHAKRSLVEETLDVVPAELLAFGLGHARESDEEVLAKLLLDPRVVDGIDEEDEHCNTARDCGEASGLGQSVAVTYKIPLIALDRTTRPTSEATDDEEDQLPTLGIGEQAQWVGWRVRGWATSLVEDLQGRSRGRSQVLVDVRHAGLGD